jgi:hypothetical protein
VFCNKPPSYDELPFEFAEEPPPIVRCPECESIRQRLAND